LPSYEFSLAEAQLLIDYHRDLPMYERTRRIAHTQVEYYLTAISSRLEQHERLEVKSRVKSFDSALAKLKKDYEGGLLPKAESFGRLEDMVGIRVIAFPLHLVDRIDEALRSKFQNPEPDRHGLWKKWKKYVVGLKGHSKSTVRFELQIVPYILWQFLDIEHDVIYKRPERVDPKAIRQLELLQQGVLKALNRFERRASRILRPLPDDLG